MKPNAYIACDPGHKGSFCLLVPEQMQVAFKPTTLSPIELLDWFNQIKEELLPRVIMIEDVSSIPGASAGSNFKFGFNVGLMHGVIRSTGISVDCVRPKTWQREVGVSVPNRVKGNTRKTAIKKEVAAIAERLYPKAEIYGSRGGLLDGRSDSLLIAHYAYRLYPFS